MQLRRRREMKVPIPTGPMADIAFLLIIFFTLTTVFRKELGLNVIIPQAHNTERILKSRNVSNIYVDKTGRISVDDLIINPGRVSLMFRLKIVDNPALIAQLRCDKETKYGVVSEVLDALREAGALRIVFATEFERG